MPSRVPFDQFLCIAAAAAADVIFAQVTRQVIFVCGTSQPTPAAVNLCQRWELQCEV
jgi:hypothetical protein